ncbi:hypothetical protein BU23DRAFT_570440 [Bimuria novae-zelandiae CBS 107.79]|uniref:INO80 complex subunit F domain-containing protein n=1 Tax=Bimuria novae-zelandiae CBS 107.79 TaxID=1447943 RepID=A0A6A5V3D0_9PLEO|nr:hypothetical protein BU23DRAFT_570440 [Bimuria novae-zelandiae CBS 107.79]
MPQPAQRALSQADLPPSVEKAYYKKCIDLRRRITDIEESNDSTRVRIKRLHRGIQKMRLERAFLLEQLHKHMEFNVDDSDRSSSPPPTPTDKPLRSKRSHRKGTPPTDSQTGSGAPAQQASPSNSHHQPLLHAMNPMSSAQSTPDPSRSNNPFFSNVGAAATSPHAVNGNSQPILPPLHTLPSLQAQGPVQRAPEPSRGAYFDPVSEESRPPPVETEGDFTGRRRALSSANPPAADHREIQNGDTEMTDAAGAGFTAVNRG